jgi:hypothetical protein
MDLVKELKLGKFFLICSSNFEEKSKNFRIFLKYAKHASSVFSAFAKSTKICPCFLIVSFEWGMTRLLQRLAGVSGESDPGKPPFGELTLSPEC